MTPSTKCAHCGAWPDEAHRSHCNRPTPRPSRFTDARMAHNNELREQIGITKLPAPRDCCGTYSAYPHASWCLKRFAQPTADVVALVRQQPMHARRRQLTRTDVDAALANALIPLPAGSLGLGSDIGPLVDGWEREKWNRSARSATVTLNNLEAGVPRTIFLPTLATSWFLNNGSVGANVYVKSKYNSVSLFMMKLPHGTCQFRPESLPLTGDADRIVVVSDRSGVSMSITFDLNI